MPSQAQGFISLFRTIVLAAFIALLMTCAVLPMAAQDSHVPPTAVQASRMPQFASRLAHPAGPPASQAKPAVARQASRRGPGGGQIIYDNGPINGRTDAWTINFGFIVSDTFTVSNQPTPVTGMSFGAWLFPGDTLTSVEVSITSEPDGGTSYFDQTVNFTQGACTANQYGYNVCTVTAMFDGPTLNEGTYWVNLQNASVPTGDPAYWDENSGVGCDSPGCPSQADNNSVGSIPSEAFTILGSSTTICINPGEQKPANTARAVTVPPSPTQTYRVIYNFTGGADSGTPGYGLAIDAAGNIYGTTSRGGLGGDAGTVFKLTPHGSSWTFNRLYAFSGANGISPDSPLVLGSDGRLYGTTAGGGGTGWGVLFGLSPAGNILPTPFSNWTETLLYGFTNGNDGAVPGGSFVLDSAGNIYGSAAAAGANHGGTLYEFSNGGIQVLHAFPAFQNDGVTPVGVVQGPNGLYGITAAGGEQRSGTLYTTAGGYQVLHSFTGTAQEGSPTGLAADQVGNLYGSSSYAYSQCWDGRYTTFYGTSVFQLSSPTWNPVILQNNDFINLSPVSYAVSTDASGNVYGTDSSQELSYGNVFKLTCCWNYTDLHEFAGPPNDGANPLAPPVVDAQGNIYGTTTTGGAYGYGVVWEITP